MDAGDGDARERAGGTAKRSPGVPFRPLGAERVVAFQHRSRRALRRAGGGLRGRISRHGPGQLLLLCARCLAPLGVCTAT